MRPTRINRTYALSSILYGFGFLSLAFGGLPLGVFITLYALFFSFTRTVVYASVMSLLVLVSSLSLLNLLHMIIQFTSLSSKGVLGVFAPYFFGSLAILGFVLGSVTPAYCFKWIFGSKILSHLNGHVSFRRWTSFEVEF